MARSLLQWLESTILWGIIVLRQGSNGILFVVGQKCELEPTTLVNIAPGDTMSWNCNGICHDCFLRLVVDTPFDHQYYVRVLSNGVDVSTNMAPNLLIGPQLQGGGGELDIAADGQDDLVVELQCDPNNPLGDCTDMEISFAIISCQCSPTNGPYITTGCVMDGTPAQTQDIGCITEWTSTYPPMFCFSLSSTVITKEKGLVPLKELQVGDEILTQDGSTYDLVHAIPHYHPTQPTTFLQIHTNTRKIVEVTHNHLLYVANKKYPIPASAIAVGDILMSSRTDPKNNENDIVTQMVSITKPGYIAPFTMSGKVLVNHVMASSYVTLLEEQSTEYLELFGIPIISHHDGIHMYTAPYRFLCGTLRLCGTGQSRNELEGSFTPYIQLGVMIRQWNIQMNIPFIQLLSLVLLMVIGLPIVIVSELFIYIIDSWDTIVWYGLVVTILFLLMVSIGVAQRYCSPYQFKLEERDEEDGIEQKKR